MKIGFCMLLWTTGVSEAHRAILQDLKRTGYDGVEIPIFAGDPDSYRAIGRMLDDIGLERTGITVIPTLDKNPLSDDPAVRRAGLDYMRWAIDCTEALGGTQIAGPLHQTLGHFTGQPTKATEFERARQFHRDAGDHAKAGGVKIVLEAINRFESYFVNTMDDLARYLESLDHPAVTGMYDTFHANIEEQDPVGAFSRNAQHLSYVHISENDRGAPGRGHVPWAETFKAIKRSGYDGWLTIEAFGRALPELAAAARVWRDFAESPEAVYREGFRTIRDGWDAA
jgi:D-psicose/D-tagatose/L-ribulose 3-epimerase